MNRLQTELQRLYLSPDAQASEGRARAMVLELSRPASWDSLAKVWHAVQADLELPAPAIAVSGIDGYQLWFSCLQSVPVAQAVAFMESLRRRYLGEIARERVGMHAGPAVVPPAETAGGRWSAFVAPDLAAVFADEPWIDLAPGPEAQADLLSRLESTKPGAWKRALERLGTTGAAGPETRQEGSPDDPRPAATASDLGPRRFLLEVMNDRAIDLPLRIEAAKALLPYFEGERPP